MRYVLALPAYIAALLLAPHAALAASNTSACYGVSDPDARTYCLARAKREPALCYNVQRADLRSLCLAEVRR